LGAEVANVLGFKYLFFLVGGIAVLGFLLLIILDWIDGKGAKESMLYSLKYRTKR